MTVSKIKYKHTRICLILLVGMLLVCMDNQICQASGIGYITGFTIRPDHVVAIEVGPHRLYVQICAGNIVKVDFHPNGLVDMSTPVISTQKWEPITFSVDSTSDAYFLKTREMSVRIQRNPCRISVMDTTGSCLIKEQDVMGVFSGGLKLQHQAGDALYGIYGYNRDDMNVGLLRQKGGYIQAKPQGGCGAPFIWSTAGYGIIVDTDGGDIYNDGSLLSFNNCSKKNVEYYVMVGAPRQILEAAGKITGKPPLLPKWNTGFGQMEWGINEAEYKDHITGYRQRNIPLDWFMIDFDWMAWGEDHYGEFRWGKKFPSGSTGELKKWSDDRGVKMFAITKPRIIAKNADGSFTEQGNYAQEHNFWWPGEKFFNDYVSKLPSKDLNYSIPECRTWWWNHLKKGGYDKGMVAFLNDECDDSNAGGLYSLGNFSNLFMQQSIYEGMRSANNQRVWSLNRTAYLGSQRYAYGLWSGDNFASYRDLRSQLGKMLSAANILVDNWGFVVSAFWHDRPPLTADFYIRSLQTGLFAPVFFIHGMYGQKRQPWVMGTKAEKIAKEVIQTRYRLIPYTYSYERIKHEKAIGICRPLILDYPDDKKVADLYETFMYGDYILASPVVDSAQTLKDIYMPGGTWIDYKNGKIYQGNKTYQVPINKETLQDIPMFIKKGAIIPNQEVMNYEGEKIPSIINMDIFPDRQLTNFNYYEDDGHTYNYEKGVYLKQSITVKDQGNAVLLNISAKLGSYVSGTQYFLLKVHYRQSKTVKNNNSPLLRFKDGKALSKAAGEGWTTGEDVYGKITFIKIKACNNYATYLEIGGKELLPNQ
jgi:alpha-glucosidase